MPSSRREPAHQRRQQCRWRTRNSSMPARIQESISEVVDSWQQWSRVGGEGPERGWRHGGARSACRSRTNGARPTPGDGRAPGGILGPAGSGSSVEFAAMTTLQVERTSSPTFRDTLKIQFEDARSISRSRCGGPHGGDTSYLLRSPANRSACCAARQAPVNGIRSIRPDVSHEKSSTRRDARRFQAWQPRHDSTVGWRSHPGRPPAAFLRPGSPSPCADSRVLFTAVRNEHP